MNNRFIQLHILTSYPPANLNRDDLGRPKTAKMGGVDRLRVSSQSLKRHWRTSELFQQALEGHVGTRTKVLGLQAYDRLVDAGIGEKNAFDWAKSIAGVFGALKKANKDKPLQELEIEQLVHISPSEQQAIDQLVDTLISEQRGPEKAELELLRHDNRAADIALFGRMLASKTAYNTEAACQVAHAISVHPVVIEDDYFTAVDDLNIHRDDAGAAHIGETGFAAGLFYSYICINRELLMDNLGGDEALARKAIAALTEAALKVAPSGKQNSFGSRAYASYALAEKGDQQPRSLSAAFLMPIDQNRGQSEKLDFAKAAIEALEQQRDHFDRVYGDCCDSKAEINVVAGTGSLAELLAFVSE
ncbi:type I-E CRISPR-associated protein Cas7/Cse4/CasC [Marinobacterium arenosum]|uniref:type I-E CRISPR-associated protein Cas7/Cse4/CasC n=1 Tax=Marinobacterium arenosum TaxID=2862496 RepID=UPI001C98A477|nr:type I-E CRISPR-associated protein Cas7/Cse4/CasC [Marinobacterium arenosum]MBY4678206.1 type I-E CRISPR-associated protein Cas7/Cse4/CasC [Marinobacterium arenosum]